jgi:DNA repair protein RadC
LASASDEQLLELLLRQSGTRRRARALTRSLLARFGSYSEVITARPERLREIDGLSETLICKIKMVELTAQRLARTALEKRSPMTSATEALEYCRVAMAYAEREAFRVLFLDSRNGLIADEVQGVGSVNHAHIFPREIVRRALEFGASALILVHNHPSGDPTPSRDDVRATHGLVEAARPLGIGVLDHLIVGRYGDGSLKALGLM